MEKPLHIEYTKLFCFSEKELKEIILNCAYDQMTRQTALTYLISREEFNAVHKTLIDWHEYAYGW